MSVILIHFTPKGSNSARSAAAADRKESDRKDKEEQRQDKKEFNREFERQERDDKKEEQRKHHEDRDREKKAKSLNHGIGAYPGAPTASLPEFNKRKANV